MMERTPAPALLLPRVASGDRAAIQECLQRFGGLVWSLARRGTRSREDAEDAVQDIFVEVWRSAPRFDPQAGSETTFIATIARRRLLDRRRSRSRRPDTEPISQSPPQAATTLAPEISAEAAQAARALDQLRPEQRQVLILTTCHGLSHEEVATSMGMPLGTVKAHARRGLLRMREALGAAPLEAAAGGAR